MKAAAERYLDASGVAATVIAATAFTELWAELLADTAAKSGRPVVFGRGDNPINFVSVEDVAWLVERVVVDPTTRGSRLEIGGPQNLTFNELAAAVQAAAGRPGAPRHVPRVALRLMANTVGRIKAERGRQARAALGMDTTDLTFDAGPIHRAYPDLPMTSVATVLAGTAAPVS